MTVEAQVGLVLGTPKLGEHGVLIDVDAMPNRVEDLLCLDVPGHVEEDVRAADGGQQLPRGHARSRLASVVDLRCPAIELEALHQSGEQLPVDAALKVTRPSPPVDAPARLDFLHVPDVMAKP